MRRIDGAPAVKSTKPSSIKEERITNRRAQREAYNVNIIMEKIK
jgi:hypothetical protein